MMAKDYILAYYCNYHNVLDDLQQGILVNNFQLINMKENFVIASGSQRNRMTKKITGFNRLYKKLLPGFTTTVSKRKMAKLHLLD